MGRRGVPQPPVVVVPQRTKATPRAVRAPIMEHGAASIERSTRRGSPRHSVVKLARRCPRPAHDVVRFRANGWPALSPNGRRAGIVSGNAACMGLVFLPTGCLEPATARVHAAPVMLRGLRYSRAPDGRLPARQFRSLNGTVAPKTRTRLVATTRAARRPAVASARSTPPAGDSRRGHTEPLLDANGRGGTASGRTRLPRRRDDTGTSRLPHAPALPLRDAWASTPPRAARRPATSWCPT